jgi:hypothetical protein
MLILFYKKIARTRFGIYDQLRMDALPALLPDGVTVTYDRGLYEAADVVVFNVPFLRRELSTLTKQPQQLWVGWTYESEANYEWMQGVRGLFDVWMSYHLDADVVCPYYDYSMLETLYGAPASKTGDVCMFVSSPVNQSRRLEYLRELMRYISVDSYGRVQRTCTLPNDAGYTSKLEAIRSYKFTVAFENAVSKDYVTEKLFEPLVAGSVPVYLGAPNVEDFAPRGSFINAKSYTPRALASLLNALCADEERYSRFFDWKRGPLQPSLHRLIAAQQVHPFLRMIELCNKLKTKKPYFIPHTSSV